MSLTQLESRLNYQFRNAELLRQAMTHRSHSPTHNERLEFLGDSVLNCVVAALLFKRFADLDEGDLSRVRANLVKQQSLYEIAQALAIADFLRLGEGELKSGGFRRPSILADTLEAIFGAIYVDQGFEAAQAVIERLYIPILDHIDPRTLGKDIKSPCPSTPWWQLMVRRTISSSKSNAMCLSSKSRCPAPAPAVAPLNRRPRKKR